LNAATARSLPSWGRSTRGSKTDVCPPVVGGTPAAVSAGPLGCAEEADCLDVSRAVLLPAASTDNPASAIPVVRLPARSPFIPALGPTELVPLLAPAEVLSIPTDTPGSTPALPPLPPWLAPAWCVLTEASVSISPAPRTWAPRSIGPPWRAKVALPLTSTPLRLVLRPRWTAAAGGIVSAIERDRTTYSRMALIATEPTYTAITQ